MKGLRCSSAEYGGRWYDDTTVYGKDPRPALQGRALVSEARVLSSQAEFSQEVTHV